MRTALGMEAGGEYDRLMVLALALLFQPSTQALGRGMIIECYESKGSKRHKGKRKAAPAKVAQINTQVAGAAVDCLPSHHAEKLWGAVPGTAQLGLLEQILLYALMNEDGGWLRAARDRIETLRRNDKLGATHARVGALCANVCQALRQFWGDPLPEDMVRAASWQRGGTWMAECIVLGALDNGHATMAAGLPQAETLVQAEWLLSTLVDPRLALELPAAMVLGTLDAPSYPYLAAVGAQVRRGHLGKSVNTTVRGAGCEVPDAARVL
jgi:hypothetical protein